MPESLYWVPGPWPGRMAILARPRGADWLSTDVRAWARSGLGVAVSFLTSAETAELDLEREAEHCRSDGIAFSSFPIPDRGIPASYDETMRRVTVLGDCLAAGKSVCIHCRQGIGRSALVAACVLVSAHIAPSDAFNAIAAARGCPVPETPEQREWVETFARRSAAPAVEPAPLLRDTR